MSDDIDYGPLTERLNKARGASKFLLDVALQALATEGVQGTLVIHIPRKSTDPLEVEFVGKNPPKE